PSSRPGESGTSSRRERNSPTAQSNARAVSATSPMTARAVSATAPPESQRLETARTISIETVSSSNASTRDRARSSVRPAWGPAACGETAGRVSLLIRKNSGGRRPLVPFLSVEPSMEPLQEQPRQDGVAPCAGPTDHSLLRRFRSGSEDAATELYVRYVHRLR